MLGSSRFIAFVMHLHSAIRMRVLGPSHFLRKPSWFLQAPKLLNCWVTAGFLGRLRRFQRPVVWAMLSRTVKARQIPALADGRRGLFRGRLQRETRQGYVLLCMALWSVISFLFITNFVFSTVTISGQSMAPTLKPGEQYFLNRWACRIFGPGYGDLVVLRDSAHQELLVKRVIALPNDVVQVEGDHVCINGRQLHEPYLPAHVVTRAARMTGRSVKLGPDEFFVMGDNRSVSEDSRNYGPVRRADLLGTLSIDR
jgi:signal peptidase I